MPPTRFSHSLSRRTFVRSIAGIGTLAIPGVTLAQSEPVLPAGTYTIRQKSTNRYVDAHDSADWDYGLVTRPAQNNNTQQWYLARYGTIYTLQQMNTQRYADAYEDSGEDYRLVTRPVQNNDSQHWVAIYCLDGDFTFREFRFRQVSTRRYMDAWTDPDHDFRLVTRPLQRGNQRGTQCWLMNEADSDNLFTIQQMSNNRYVDAHDTADWDYGIVTRGPQNNSTEWPMGPFSQAPKWYLRICSWRSRRLPRSRWHRS